MGFPPSEGVCQIPGVGVVSKPGICGTYHTSFACVKDHNHFKQKVPHKCFNLSCPECYTAALTRQGKRIAKTFRGVKERIDRLDLSVDPETAKHLRLMITNAYHVLISFPPGRYPEGTPINKIRRAGIDVALAVGLEGAPAVFVHPWRVLNPIKTRLIRRCKNRDILTEQMKEKKFWALIHEDALKFGDWRKYVYWSPHIHMVAAVGYIMPQTTPEEKEAFKKKARGCIVKKIGKPLDIEKLENCFNGQTVEDPLVALAYYAGSHAAYEPGHRLYVSFGIFDSKNIRKDGKAVDNKQQMVCPKCNSPVAFGQDIENGTFQYEPGTKGDLWKPRLINLQSQKYLIRGVDPLPPKRDKMGLRSLPGSASPVAASAIPQSSGSWLFDKWGMK